MKPPIYFECHITIEPVFDKDLEKFKALCLQHGFKVAELLMQKRKEDSPERSQKDSFCTGRAKDYDSLFEKMNHLSQALKNNNFKVWRMKIEAILFDQKFNKEEL